MILNDATIADAIEDGTIEISPIPSPDQIQPASLDIRLGDELMDAPSGQMQEPPFAINPYRRYIGTTMETVGLPDWVAAQLTGRSTLGRMGIVIHLTAGWIDPGFNGEVTLEILNFSDDRITLEPGTRIGQLVFFTLLERSSGYDGQYQGQSGPTSSGNL